ncbi:uncharacterized protein [Rutidosis leptorrhynchoides]|uniref:uncharacterized protein n=1 Tax=Rutidosis leptorrhynchoides TaxID=125765 RepID=UPI003A99E5D5
MEEKQEFLDVSRKVNNLVDEKHEEKVDDNEAPEFVFTFKFPTFEEFSKKHKDSSQFMEPSSYVHANSFAENIVSDEVSLEANEVDANLNDGFVLDECPIHEIQKGYDDDQWDNNFEDQECVVEKIINESSSEKKIEEIEKKEEIDTFTKGNLEKVDDEIVDSNINLVSSNSPLSPTFDLNLEDGFLSDGDFELVFDVKVEKDDKEHNNWTESDFLSENNFGANSSNPSENEKSLSNDTTNKLESLWEHQEMIEQLKMEIKKVRAIGLPTIFEESESSPKFMEELKPWKIEEVYQHGGTKMGDVHKFYKTYRERMRKFDIFNYQKMYAIGFLQLKDPLWSPSSSKSSIPEITTLFSQSFTNNKGKKHEDDPTITFIKELQSDLEVVYIGQMCLSWEILHWQYEKALDIWESDPRGVRRFNEIADEFQQFQVLLQRFIEDELFQGPRIQNYVKKRCVFRNLLQVPVIRDDHLKSKKAKSKVVTDITSDALVEILEESIRIFWRFVRADKYKRQAPVELQSPEDSQLFMDLQKDLHKKQRKLKEQLRSGNCILKKLRSCREDDEIEDQVLYFFCQVDMKLVSRVLQMSKLTSEQLVWCHNKLSQVSFVNKKIRVEPSFLLFPG